MIRKMLESDIPAPWSLRMSLRSGANRDVRFRRRVVGDFGGDNCPNEAASMVLRGVRDMLLCSK
jgi:hypothetical protein